MRTGRPEEGAGEHTPLDRPEHVPVVFAEAWNRRDPDALAGLFEEDAEFVNVVGLWWHDQEAIRKAHAYGLQHIFQRSSLRLGAVRVKRLSEGVAVGMERSRVQAGRASCKASPRIRRQRNDQYTGMPRNIQITTSHETTEKILQRVRGVEGVVGITLQEGSSIEPPGDVLTLQTTNSGCRAVLRVLDEVGVGDSGCISTSEPRSTISPKHQAELDSEDNETIWEEMAFMLRRNTNLVPNYLTLMALAGAVAAVGLWQTTLYVVLAAMVIAPAFEPLTRIPFGLIGGPRALAMRGAKSAVAGYFVMALGAALTLWVLQGLEIGGTSDLESLPLVQHWSTVTPAGAVLAVLGGAAGATIITAQRPVLSTGVQIALALIPSMSVVGMALATADVSLAGRGLVRWAMDVVLILLANTLVLGLKQWMIQRRHVPDAYRTGQ